MSECRIFYNIYFLHRIQYPKKEKEKIINQFIPIVGCLPHLFPLRKTKVLRYWTRSPSKYLTSSNGILSEALSHDTFSQCSCINSLLTTSIKLESMLKSLEFMMNQFKVKVQIQNQNQVPIYLNQHWINQVRNLRLNSSFDIEEKK